MNALRIPPILGITMLALASPPCVLADRQPYSLDIEPAMESCDLEIIAYDWSFATGDHGFTTSPCDSNFVEVWEYGSAPLDPPAPGHVWGTILEGDYPLSSGQRLVSPPFVVDENSYLVEVYHFIHVESVYDGMHVKIGGEVVHPVVPYPEIISPGQEYYAWCVDNQPGWTGLGEDGALGWQLDCFDLGAYFGQEVSLAFEFGSDTSISYPGWYIAYVRVGASPPTGPVGETWGRLKSRFRQAGSDR